MLFQGLLLLCLLQSGHVLHLIAPLALKATLGRDVNISCSFTINNPPIDQKFLAISWYFKGNKILTVQNTKEKTRDPRMSCTGMAKNGIADLFISNITIMDGGTYKCSILYTPRKEEKEIRLDIQATPQINITDNVVVVNTESSLCCVISGFYPVGINIKWLRDGETLDNWTLDEPQRDLDSTYSVRSLVTITPTQEDRERTFSCTVQHESLTTPLQEDFKLVYGDIPTVHVTSQVFQMNVKQMLVCSVYGFYPESIAVKWFLNNTLLGNTKTQRINSSAVESVCYFIPTKQNWGMELSCVVEHGTLITPHVERLLVQGIDLKAQYKLHVLIVSAVVVFVFGLVIIVLLYVKERKGRPKVTKINRTPEGIFRLAVDHFHPDNITISWEVIQPPSNTKHNIGSTITLEENQDGTFNATSICESLRQVIQEEQPYIVQAVVEHNKLKRPVHREWKSDDEHKDV